MLIIYLFIYFLVDMLQKFITQTTVDQFYIITDCENQRVESDIIDWCLCSDETKRKVFITQSTFTLIPAPLDNDMISTAMMQTRIFESLKFGAIPVFLEYDRIGLPFDEVKSFSIFIIGVCIKAAEGAKN